MPVLGITGGIATGKSTFVQAFAGQLPAQVFDADLAAHELLSGDLAVRAAVVEAFGTSVLDGEGRPDRQRLRELVFADPSKRKTLEEILHPRIRARWAAGAEQFRDRPDWLLVDIPLLFETGAQSHFERVVVVACSREAQIQRLRENRNIQDALIENIIGAQLDLGSKVRLGQHVIWNDSTREALESQARLLAGFLRSLYG